MNRRRFIGIAAALAVPGTLSALVARPTPQHPEPRPDVTAERVLPDDQVPERDRKAYAAARAYPAVLDGLYCHCDCAERDGMRSLLSCFESKMPQTCRICRSEAELAATMAADGKSLAEIRKAVDERWG